MKPLAQFIEENRIRMTVEPTFNNPHMTDMPPGSRHYKCALRRGTERMTVPFSMGPAHRSKPTTADVLSCLASDSASVDDARSFEEWALDLGFDTDSRKAEKLFRSCAAQARRLRVLLGEDLYRELLYETERG
jgi:hypothetical protein